MTQNMQSIRKSLPRAKDPQNSLYAQRRQELGTEPPPRRLNRLPLVRALRPPLQLPDPRACHVSMRPLLLSASARSFHVIGVRFAMARFRRRVIERVLWLCLIAERVSCIQLADQLARGFSGFGKLVADLAGRDLDETVPAKALNAIRALYRRYNPASEMTYLGDRRQPTYNEMYAMKHTLNCTERGKALRKHTEGIRENNYSCFCGPAKQQRCVLKRTPSPASGSNVPPWINFPRSFC